MHSLQKQKRLYFMLSFLPFSALLPSVAYQFPPEQFLHKSLAHESSSQGLFLGQSTKDGLLRGYSGVEGKSFRLSLGATEENQHKISRLNETLACVCRKMTKNVCKVT